MRRLLKNYFGYDSFRPLQEEIIGEVLAGKDAFVLMPTGGGKSLCYQLPALKLDGLTLVVSPLISLMKDQVDALQANGIRADFLNSTLSQRDIIDVERRAEAGDLKLLYIAPERLAVQSFRHFLQGLKVSLIAIDEAHCISEWGHDFRPDYRNLKLLRQEFPKVPVIALTATATEQVRSDIIRQLNLQKARVFISSFNRPNLSYYVQPKRQAYAQLIGLLDRFKDQSAIIYCFSRKDAEKIADSLRQDGFAALAYHAGLDNETRQRHQEMFTKDKVQIIAATIAFGMGIDKPDVRVVVHYSLPKSIEGYYQETGRAGRDGLPSECHLLYSYGDTAKHEFFIRDIRSEVERKNAREKLRRVIDYAELQSCRRRFLLGYFGEEMKSSQPENQTRNCGACDACLSTAEEADATVEAQKIMSAILRTGERFGSNYVARVLKGGRDQQIRERGHDQLPVFGIMAGYKEEEIKQITRQLIGKGLLEQSAGEYPVIRLTAEGKMFLNERRSLSLLKRAVEKAKPAKVPASTLQFDQGMFSDLRALRKQIAADLGVPPFVVFGDASLQEMAYYLPQSSENFLKISGVGEEKLKKFGPDFIRLIRAYAVEHNLPERVRPKTAIHPRRSTRRRWPWP